MDSRISFLIKNTEHNAYLNKLANGLEYSLFNGIWFKTREHAESWMQGIYGPKDQENYTIVEAVTYIQEVEEDEYSESGTEESQVTVRD